MDTVQKGVLDPRNAIAVDKFSIHCSDYIPFFRTVLYLNAQIMSS